MCALWLSLLLYWGFSLPQTFAQKTSSFSRPLDLQLNHPLGFIYEWVGSYVQNLTLNLILSLTLKRYYNGTTQLEFTPHTEWTTESLRKERCHSNDTTLTQDMKSIFVITEPGNSSESNPVNMGWGLWPKDFNFTSWAQDKPSANWGDFNTLHIGPVKGTMSSFGLKSVNTP